MVRSYVAMFLLVVLSCCTKKEINNPGDYMKWMNNPKNGLIKIKYANGLKLTVKYLSPEYLTNLELKEEKAVSCSHRDSLIKAYRKGFNFLLAVGPDDRKQSNGDVMLKNVNTYEEYAERMLVMNFGMEEYVTLVIDGKQFKPVLSGMENLYGLGEHRNISFAFVPEAGNLQAFEKAETIDFVYEDDIFDLGINHFRFNQKDIKRIPGFNSGHL